MKIEVGVEPAFYELIDYRKLHSLTKLFKIKIENTDRSKTISGCKVSITSMNPAPGNRSPWVLVENLSLAAGDSALVPLASYEERRDPEMYPDRPAMSDTFEIHSLNEHRPLLGIEYVHTLHLRCTAIDTPFLDATIELSVVAGRFQIEKI